MSDHLKAIDKYRFFIFTLLFSWLIWIPLAVAQVNVKASPWFYLLVIGGPSPSIFGIIFIIKNKLYSKKTFIKSFLSFKQIGIRNFIFLVLTIVIPFGLSLVLDFILFQNVPHLKRIQEIFATPISSLSFIILSIYAGPLSEEFGWRGFAAKVLLKEHNFIKTALVIGIVWSTWHYPLLFLNGQYVIDNYFTYIPIRFIKEVSLSIIILFFFKATGKSVLSAMLIHFLANVLVNLFAPITFTSNIIHTSALLLAAVALIIRIKSEPARDNRIIYRTM